MKRSELISRVVQEAQSFERSLSRQFLLYLSSLVMSSAQFIRLPSSAVYPHKGSALFHISLHAHLSLVLLHSQLSLPSSITWCLSTYRSLHASGSASLSSNTCCRDQPLACQMMLRAALPSSSSPLRFPLSLSQPLLTCLRSRCCCCCFLI